MGAKTWMLVQTSGNAREILSSSPKLDRKATLDLARRLFPKERLEPIAADGSLAYTCPPDDELHIGCFGNLSILAARELGLDHPSQLDSRFLQGSPTVYLHAMHSVVDWFAFALWQEGKLVRALSLSPDSGIVEDIGPRLSFEASYWSGEQPVLGPDEEDEEYPLPFHPLELGEAALHEFLGYQLEGPVDRSLFEPEAVALLRFRRKRRRFPWWS